MSTYAVLLNGAAVITTATAPSLGSINRYNASSGALTQTLPALAGLTVGANCIVEKDTQDGTLNAVTLNCNAGDTFDDGQSALTLIQPGEKRTLQVISPSGTKYWKVTGGLHPRTGLTAITSQFALTNSTAASTIVSYNIPPGTLGAGSVFRACMGGSVQFAATSGTLTFTPYIQGTALAQTVQVPSQSGAGGPVGFWLDYLFTVRTAGTSGTGIAQPRGFVPVASWYPLNSTSTATTTINTTSAASSNALYVQAQWQTASASNSLLVQAATIERVI